MERMNYQFQKFTSSIKYQRYGNRIHEGCLIDDHSRDYDVNVINSKINIRNLGMVQKAAKKHGDTRDGL